MTPALSLRLPGDIPITFQAIPATGPKGFLLGSRGESYDEEPQHRVVISRAFYLATFPVTQAQFGAWTKLEKIDHKNGFESELGSEDFPAENMDWFQANAFCEWVTRHASGFPAGYIACLPTESEWEYACGGGAETEYWNGDGDGEAALREVGWFDGNSEERTHPVGLKKPNGFGLYDMHGNVREWCRDVYDPQAYRKRAEGWIAREWTLQDARNDADYWDDEARRKGLPSRVLRGGSWIISAWRCRSAYRIWDRPGNRNRGNGFRVCLVPGPTATGSGEAEPTPGDGGRRKRPESDGVGGASAGAPDLATASFPKVSAGASTHQGNGEGALLCGVQWSPPTDVEGYGEVSELVTRHFSLTSGGAEAPAEAGHRGRQLIQQL